jgi:alkylhydroperoxidase family enzyme
MEDRFGTFREATAEALLRSPAATPPQLRQAVARGEPPPELAVLVEKIRRHAYKVTDADLDALRARYTEDQLFEIVVAAAFGAARERLEAGLRALGEA